MYEFELRTAREDVDFIWATSRAALRHKPVEASTEKQQRDVATKGAHRDHAWVRSALPKYYLVPLPVLTRLCRERTLS